MPNNWVLRLLVLLIMVQVLGKYMYLDPQDLWAGWRVRET